LIALFNRQNIINSQNRARSKTGIDHRFGHFGANTKGEAPRKASMASSSPFLQSPPMSKTTAQPEHDPDTVILTETVSEVSVPWLATKSKLFSPV
jgi:hypothetical protein